jgi:hypothetical protein
MIQYSGKIGDENLINLIPAEDTYVDPHILFREMTYQYPIKDEVLSFF